MYESGENYLETILVLSKKKGDVHSVDIARELGFSKPSVSRAVGILKDKGYITVSETGVIELTKEGDILANKIYEKHKILTEFLAKVAKVDAIIAEEDACRMEHIISEETFEGIKRFMNK